MDDKFEMLDAMHNRRHARSQFAHDWPVWMDSDAFDRTDSQSSARPRVSTDAVVSPVANIEHLSAVGTSGPTQHQEEKKEDPAAPHAGEGQRELILSESDAVDDKSRKKNWVFTWNNYTAADVDVVNTQWLLLPDMRCVVYEKEVGRQGTPHLQGFFIFEKLKSFKQVKEMIDKRVWFAQMRKPVEANLKYCSKEGGSIYLGDVPMTQKEKGHAGREYVSTYGHVWSHLTDDIKAGMSFKALAEKYPDAHGMYPRGFREKFDLFAPKGTFNLIEKFGSLLPWQQQLLEIIEKGADARSVIWLWESKGDAGKSFMVKHLAVNHGFQPLTNAPTRDIACAWQRGHVCIDYARTDSTERNYDIIEKIKNGMMFSAKYESQTKFSDQYRDSHVICFANDPPDVSKLSMDRWKIYNIVDKKLVPQAPQDFVLTLGIALENA